MSSLETNVIVDAALSQVNRPDDDAAVAMLPPRAGPSRQRSLIEDDYEPMVIPVDIDDVSLVDHGEDDDRFSRISMSSHVSHEAAKTKTNKSSKKRKAADSYVSDDASSTSVCLDVDMISDVDQLTKSIVECANGIDELRTKSGKLQGKISGEMKRFLKHIKQIAHKISRRAFADSPIEKVRETYRAVVDHNDNLVKEMAVLHERLAAKAKAEAVEPSPLPKRAPRIISVEKIPEDKQKAVDTYLAGARQPVENLSYANGNSGVSEEAIIERVTTRVLLAMQCAEKKKEAISQSRQQRRRHIPSDTYDSDSEWRRDTSTEGPRKRSAINGDNRKKSTHVSSAYGDKERDFPPLPRRAPPMRDHNLVDEAGPSTVYSRQGKRARLTSRIDRSSGDDDRNASRERRQRVTRGSDAYSSSEENARRRDRSRSSQRDRSSSAQRKTRDRRRPPRTSVIAISKQDANVSFADILRKARNDISLQDVGIEKTRIRHSKAGELLIEVFGQDNKEKADDLAGRMSAKLTGVNIRRPVKQGELRMSGFDDSVSAANIKTALADLCTRSDSSFHVGRIVAIRGGLYTTRVRCPLDIAIFLNKQGSVKVGWSVAKLELLRAKPLRCFKCMEAGHVSANCTSDKDRSNICFRCSLHGHKASDCNDAYYCIVCAEKGLTSSHSIGSETCISNEASLTRDIHTRDAYDRPRTNAEALKTVTIISPNRSNSGFAKLNRL